MARSPSSSSISATDPTESAKILAPQGSGLTVPLPMLDALPPIADPEPEPLATYTKPAPVGPPPPPEKRTFYRVKKMNAKGRVNIKGMAHKWAEGREIDSHQYPENVIKAIRDQGVVLEEFTK